VIYGDILWLHMKILKAQLNDREDYAMYSAPRNCPVCSGEMLISRLYCPQCDVKLEGHFSFGGLSGLSQEQLAFVETFVACEGKITRVQKALGISYPTVRSRLEETILAMGYEVGAEDEEPVVDDELRKQVLDDLAAGRITSQAAVRLLQGG
jgi:hypothetical protein